MPPNHSARRKLTDPATQILERLCTSRFDAPATWQTLIRSITRKEIGDVGELYTTWMLRSLGLDVRHLGGNNVGFDLEVTACDGSPLAKALSVEVKADCDKRCIRDTWGAWRWSEPTREFSFDYLVMINLNVGRRVHVIPREVMMRWVYRHANGDAHSFRFGITDDSNRRDVGLMTNGGRYNGAWNAVRNHALRCIQLHGNDKEMGS